MRRFYRYEPADLTIRIFNYCLDVISGIILILVFGLAFYTLFDTCKVIKGSKLDKDIVQLMPDSDGNFDYEALGTINEDIIGWIKIDDTEINYPVMQSGDNDFYLARNYRKEFAAAGSIFLDYRNDFRNDNLLIIYGHRMSYGNMFTDITKYKNKKYFDQHRSGSMRIEERAYELNIIAYGLVSAGDVGIYGLKSDTVSYFRRHARYVGETRGATRFVLLSTCDSGDRTMRNVVLAEMLSQ